MGGCKRRAWTSRLFTDNVPVFETTFWPVQVAVGVKAGVPKLIMAVVEHMRAHPGQALINLDFTNALGTVWRSAVLQAVYNKQTRVETLVPLPVGDSIAQSLHKRPNNNVRRGGPAGGRDMSCYLQLSFASAGRVGTQ